MMRNERGFSLVEVLVAMMILVIGVLGLAASSTAIARMTGDGGRSAESAAVANARFEVLRATPCAALASGTATTGSYAETWTVTTHATLTLMREVTLTLQYNSVRSRRTAAYATAISCAPAAS